MRDVRNARMHRLNGNGEHEYRRGDGRCVESIGRNGEEDLPRHGAALLVIHSCAV